MAEERKDGSTHKIYNFNAAVHLKLITGFPRFVQERLRTLNSDVVVKRLSVRRLSFSSRTSRIQHSSVQSVLGVLNWS